VQTLPGKEIEEAEEAEEVTERKAEKDISNTPQNYELVQGEDAIAALVKKLSAFDEICFDTETTNLDANDAELVGLSFSVRDHEGYYVPCPADQAATKKILTHFHPLFADKTKSWVGQNIKYD